MPVKIAHQVKLIDKHPHATFIAAACIKRSVAGQENIHKPKRDNPFKSLFTTSLGITSSNLWNRQTIEQIGGWDESLKSSQEADLMFRLLQVKDEVMYDDEALTIVRERPEGQISQQNHSEKWQRFFNKRIEILEWLRKYRPEHYMSEKGFYQDALFGILKIMAEEDLKTANLLYKQYLKGHYSPSPNQDHSTKPYLVLFRLFGFRGAEVAKRLLGK